MQTPSLIQLQLELELDGKEYNIGTVAAYLEKNSADKCFADHWILNPLVEKQFGKKVHIYPFPFSDGPMEPIPEGDVAMIAYLDHFEELCYKATMAQHVSVPIAINVTVRMANKRREKEAYSVPPRFTVAQVKKILLDDKSFKLGRFSPECTTIEVNDVVVDEKTLVASGDKIQLQVFSQSAWKKRAASMRRPTPSGSTQKKQKRPVVPHF